MKKNVIIIKNEGGRLGNQFWNYASILAYCLEKGYTCRNITFKEYANIFNATHAGKLADIILKSIPGRIVNKILAVTSRLIKIHDMSQVISSGNHIGHDVVTPFYLPPSANNNVEQNASLATAESSSSPYIYFSGWLFRNPAGMAKYHKEISAFFKPNKRIGARVASTFEGLRSKYTRVIGVHIRKKDYKGYWGGRFYFTETEIRPLLDEYLVRSGADKDRTVFVICSDETVDASAFEGLNVHINDGSIGEDLFTLSSCDAIIGSDSTFGAMAAYLGDIPIVFFSKDSIDWKPLERTGYNYDNGSLNIQL